MKKASCPGHIFRMLCPGTLFSACPEACFPPVQGHEKFVCPGVQKCTMRILRNNLVIILWCIVLRIQRVHYHVIMICLFCGRGPVFIPSERQIRGSEVTSLLVVKGVFVCVCVCWVMCVVCVWARLLWGQENPCFVRFMIIFEDAAGVGGWWGATYAKELGRYTLRQIRIRLQNVSIFCVFFRNKILRDFIQG